MTPFEVFSKELDYNPETGAFKWKCAGRLGRSRRVGYVMPTGYLRIKVHGFAYKAHRIAWLLYYGEWPTCDIDHINWDKLDNSIKNLRIVNDTQNKHNSAAYSNNSSGIRGISWSHNESKYKAYIYLNGKQIHLGTFSSMEEAIAARLRAEDKYRDITLTPSRA